MWVNSRLIVIFWLAMSGNILAPGLNNWSKTIKILTTHNIERYFGKLHSISKLARKRVVISFKTAELKGDPKFFVSNNKLWNAAKILSIGRHRWPVEPFYEVSKGFLGLDKYELRDFTGIEKHWALVFLAYSIVKLQNPDCIMRSGDDIQTTFGDGLRSLQQEVLLSLCAYCYEAGKQGLSFNELIEQLFPAS